MRQTTDAFHNKINQIADDEGLFCFLLPLLLSRFFSVSIIKFQKNGTMWKASLNAGLCGSVGGGVDGVGKRSPIHIFFIPVNVTKKEHFMVNRHDSRVLNILAGIFSASNSFPFLMNSLVVLKYSNDVTVARNHQRNINTLC